MFLRFMQLSTLILLVLVLYHTFFLFNFSSTVLFFITALLQDIPFIIYVFPSQLEVLLDFFWHSRIEVSSPSWPSDGRMGNNLGRRK